MKLGIIATQIAKDDATSAFFFDDLYPSQGPSTRQPANDAKDAGRASGIFTRPDQRPRAAKTARRRP